MMEEQSFSSTSYAPFELAESSLHQFFDYTAASGGYGDPMDFIESFGQPLLNPGLMSVQNSDNDYPIFDGDEVPEEDLEAFPPSPTSDGGNESPWSRSSTDLQSIIPAHYGPGCWLSISSDPGIAWIQQRTGSADFAKIAAELATVWRRELRLERTEPTRTVQSAEPGPTLAWKYTNAYFERSVDAVFEVVHRPDFERQLRGHFEGTYQSKDPAWYALRNVVYASGLRLHQSADHAASFSHIQKEAWGYFSNALSVHSRLLLQSPSLRSVRALFAMALFAEGLGSPVLGSGLMANAMLLAQFLGLHRKIPTTEMSKPETLQRLWLFWALYTSEKSTARRYGRASVIDDGDIGCDIPTEIHARSALDPRVFRCLIQISQISSRVCKKLMGAHIQEDPPTEILEIVVDLDRELQTWMEHLPVDLRPQHHHVNPLQKQPPTRSLSTTLIQSSYYDLLMVSHAPFVYPWITQRFSCDSSSSSPDIQAKIRGQVAKSAQATVVAARKIIVMTRNFEINGANTHAFMLNYPMHAFINLFIHVVGCPTASNIRSDLALLEVAAGYFGRLDFVTGSKPSFPFARDITAIARRTVDAYAANSTLSPTATGA